MAIRDARDKNWFWLENECIDLYTRHLGVFVMAVYLSLCRHSDNETQTCYPSMQLIADELGISRKTVMRATKILEDWNFITIDKNRKEDGTQANNIYTLISSKNRKKIPRDLESLSRGSSEGLPDTSPRDSEDISRGTPVLHNNTQNTNKTQDNNTQGDTPIKDSLMVQLFNEFWTEYPLKKSKAYTYPIWLKLDPVLALKIIEDIKIRKITDRQWVEHDGKYIPHPSTYLHQRKWEDDITPVKLDASKLGVSTPHTPGKYKNVKSLEIN